MEELTTEEKEILKCMYEIMSSFSDLINIKLDGYGLTSNDIYSLFDKIGLIDIVD